MLFLSVRMAFYGWIADVRCATLVDPLGEVLRRPDLKADAEYSRDGLLFAGDPVMVFGALSSRFPLNLCLSCWLQLSRLVSGTDPRLVGLVSPCAPASFTRFVRRKVGLHN